MSEHPTPVGPEERPGLPTADRPRSRNEIREDNAELRAELGATVEELARRADVPARAREWRDETLERARTRGAQLWSEIATKSAPIRGDLVKGCTALRRWVEREPVPAAAGAGLVLLVVLIARRKRG